MLSPQLTLHVKFETQSDGHSLHIGPRLFPVNTLARKVVNSHDFERVLSGAFILLFFSLPFQRVFSTINLVIIFLLLIAQRFWANQKLDLRNLWFLPLFFVYYSTSILYTDGSWSALETRLSFLVIPLIFSTNGNWLFKQKFNFFMAFIFGNLGAILLCAVRAVIRSFSQVDGNWLFNAKVIPETHHDFLTSTVMGGNYFFNKEFSFIMDPIYFGLYIVFAQVLIYDLLVSVGRRSNVRLLLVLYFLFFVALFLLSSKAAIISSLIITLFFLLVGHKASGASKFVGVLVLSFVGIVFFYFNPRLKVFTDTFWDQLKVNPQAQFGHDLRILSWDASLDIIKRNALFGVGEGRKDSTLIRTYIAKGYTIPAREKHNTHNQYLDFLLGGGFLCLALYLCGIGHLFIRSLPRIDILVLLFVFVFSFNALIENLLSRHAGVLFFSIFFSYLHQFISGNNNWLLGKELNLEATEDA